MRIKYEIGNGPVTVDCLVILADEEVKEVIYKGTNIVDCLDCDLLDKMAEAAAKQFREEMSEP